jgi:drug/metabolite transporter (DMT)-like permease
MSVGSDSHSDSTSSGQVTPAGARHPVAGRQSIQLTQAALVAISILGALGTGAGHVLNYRLITDEGPTASSTVTYLLPVVAVVLGIVDPGDV